MCEDIPSVVAKARRLSRLTPWRWPLCLVAYLEVFWISCLVRSRGAKQEAPLPGPHPTKQPTTREAISHQSKSAG
jgi:hypothetical protein